MAVATVSVVTFFASDTIGAGGLGDGQRRRRGCSSFYSGIQMSIEYADEYLAAAFRDRQ